MPLTNAHHRKVMRALKEESEDQDVLLKKKYKYLIEDNVKAGLYSMEYILDHKLYLPEPPAIADAELRAAGKIKTIGKETEVFDVRDTKAHIQRRLDKMEKLRKSVGNFMLDDDVLLYNSLKSGEGIRMVDETPLFAPISKPKYSQFSKGGPADEQQLAPFVAKINARADELLKITPPMRSSFRLEPELDKLLDVRKREKAELLARSGEMTQQHLYMAELGALTEKAEDLLHKPTYMPKTVVGVPQNPFYVKDEAAAERKKNAVKDEEIEELLQNAEAKIIAIKSRPKEVSMNQPGRMLVMDGKGEDTQFHWYTQKINRRFASEQKDLTRFQRSLKGIRRNVDDGVCDYDNKTTLLSLGNGLTYKKDQKIHPESFAKVTKELEAADARNRLFGDVCDISKRTLKSAYSDQKMWMEDKEKRDKAAMYEAGIIPGRPKLQEEATAADKVVTDYLKGRLHV